MSNHEVVALNFPPHSEREQKRIEKGKSTAEGLVPLSMVDNGHSVLVTMKATKDWQLHQEGDKIQREYMKGQLESVEKRKGEQDE